MVSPFIRARRRVLIAFGASAGLLAGCAGLGGPPRLTFTPADIARTLERQFPQDRRLLEVFDVTLQVPRVRLLPERNRVAAVLDVGVRERLLGGTWRGQLDFDAALRWEPRDHTVRLHEARVADLRLEGASPLDPATAAAGRGAAPGAEGAAARGGRTGAERLGAVLAERALEDLVIYRLAPERVEALRSYGVAPGGISVTPRGVEVTFSPLSTPGSVPPR